MTDKNTTPAGSTTRRVKLGRPISILRLKAEQQSKHFAVPPGKTHDALESKRGGVGNRRGEWTTLDDKSRSAAVAKLNRHLDKNEVGLRKARAPFT